MARNKKSKSGGDITKIWAQYFRKGDLEDWQRLCGDLGLPNDLASKTQCRKALRRVNVNIHQFLKAQRKPDLVVFFPNLHALREYTASHNAYYPRKNIEQGSPLRALLRDMI